MSDHTVDPVELDGMNVAELSLCDIKPTPTAKNTKLKGRLSYREQQGPLVITLRDVKTYSGLVLAKHGSFCISFSLTPDQSKLCRDLLENRVLDLCVKNKAILFSDKNANWLSKYDRNFIEMNYKSFVQEGPDNKDKPGEKYNDSIMVGVPTTKKGKGSAPCINRQLCSIIDAQENEYDWMLRERATLEFVCLEVNFFLSREGNPILRLEARAMKVVGEQKFKVNVPRKQIVEDVPPPYPAKRAKAETHTKKPANAFEGKLDADAESPDPDVAE